MENQKGRSMIEMLGVLAIVGVLSVGGIAGYSKAMTKYRINKWTEEMIWVIQNFVQYKKDWMRFIGNKEDKMVNQYLKDAKLLPETWSSKYGLRDSLDNNIGFASYPDRIFYNTEIKTERTEYMEICVRHWTNIIFLYAESIYYVHMYGTREDDSRDSAQYYGDLYCIAGKNCIRDLKISDIVAKCSDLEEYKAVTISVYFK